MIQFKDRSPLLEYPERGQHRPFPALVLVRTVATRQVVVAVSDSAGGFGIRPGMTLAQARALHAGVLHLDHDPAQDARGLEALGRYLHRFSPVVMPVIADPDGAYEEGIFIDLTGCARAFNGIETLLRQLLQTFSDLRIRCCWAIAETPAAAWAMTWGQHPTHERRNLKSQISNFNFQHFNSLPVRALRLPVEICDTLEHLGLVTIEQVLNLPRESLPSRFGPTLNHRINQLLGRESEPLVPLPFYSPIEGKIEFDGPAPSTESLVWAAEKLFPPILEELTRRNQGARRIDLRILLAYAPTMDKTIHLSRPTRNRRTILNLFRCAIESVPPQRRSGSAGFLGLKITVPNPEALAEEQIEMLEPPHRINSDDFVELLSRLRLRLKEDAVMQPALVESYLPERAFAMQADADKPASNIAPPVLSRPLQLLAAPAELRVMVSPSHDRDGRPIAFTLGSTQYPVAHFTGPERIASQWWTGHCKTRDYFDVQTPQGYRFWIFRVLENAKWYLHGIFV